MAKDPAFLFYFQDFLTGTAFMTLEEKGAYITLLCYQASHGHLAQGNILRIVSVPIWDAICCKFVVDKDGLFFNNRLDLEIQKRQSYTASRRNNLHMAKHKALHMVKHMENENENENKNEKETKKNLYLDYVYLSESEYNKLIKRIGKYGLGHYIEKLNNYAGINAKRFKGYASHYSVILNWWHKDGDPVSQKDIQERQTKEFDEKYPGDVKFPVEELIKATVGGMK